jgi:hypothetical protein
LFLIGYYASLKTSSFSSEKVSINGWLRNQQWIYFSHFFFSTCLFFFVSSNSGFIFIHGLAPSRRYGGEGEGKTCELSSVFLAGVSCRPIQG